MWQHQRLQLNYLLQLTHQPAVVAIAIFQHTVPAPAPGPATVAWAVGGVEVLTRTPGGTAVFGFMPVVPMVIISALLMLVVSTVTHKPAQTTIAKYFQA